MEMCFFSLFAGCFIKDRLKEKSDVSFMASPSGEKCCRRALAAKPLDLKC